MAGRRLDFAHVAAHIAAHTAAHATAAVVGAAVVGGMAPRRLGAQPPPCHWLCAPSLSVRPGAITTHVFGGPRVRALPGGAGAEQRLPSRTNLEVIVAAGARTALPRTGLYASVQWLPNASENANPFTLYTAADVGAARVRANAPTLSAGASVAVLDPQQTAHWLALHLNVGDLYSQAARPGDRSAYTHKLDVTLVADLSPFSRLPSHAYLQGVTAYAMLDHVATGLPRAGDEVPNGRRVFLTGARNASVIAGLAFPLTPAAP